MAKLTKRMIDEAKTTGRTQFIWDTELRGFGLRVAPGGTKSFVVQYRLNTRERRQTLARYGVLTVDEARTQALQVLAAVKRGEDPRRKHLIKQPTVTDLLEEFIKTHVEIKKSATQEQYKGLLKNHIGPALGKLLVSEVTRNDVTKLVESMRDKPYAANRTLAVLSKMFNMAEVRGYRQEQSNPCRLVERYPESARRRFLQKSELQRLAAAVDKREATEPSVVRAIRLLLFTGARVNEILTLEWSQVDFAHKVLRLPDSKTGAKEIALSEPALALLQRVQRRDGDRWVVPGRFEGKHLSSLHRPWSHIRDDAGLEGIRLHDLRRTFASLGASAGISLHMVGSLLGHKHVATTQRYAYLYKDPQKTAVNQIAAALDSNLRPSD